MIDLKLTGHPQILFNRYDGNLHIFGDLKDGGDIKAVILLWLSYMQI